MSIFEETDQIVAEKEDVNLIPKLPTPELVSEIKAETPAFVPVPIEEPAPSLYRQQDTYRDLLLMALASQVIKMSDSSAEIAQLRSEIGQLRKTLKAAFLAIGHGPIGATFEAPAPKAVVMRPIEDNDDREGLTEEAVQEALRMLPKE